METKKSESRPMTPERRKRINRLKKIIAGTVLFMILFPILGCVVLGVMLYRTNSSAERMSEQITFMEKALQESADEKERIQELLRIDGEIRQEAQAGIEYEELPGMEDVPEVDAETEDGIRRVYLTFDDGPSIYTEELLDILAQYDVKATFFVTAKGKEDYGDIYRRIVEEGHTLGMHSYSHEYSNIYASLENFQEDIEKLRNFLYRETGTVSRFYRFPGGSSNTVSATDIHEFIRYLNAMDIDYFDWNVSSGDASSVRLGSDEIVDRVVREIPSRRVAVVLMHDAADKHSTVEALPRLIEEIQGMEDGTEILPITEETMLIQHVSGE
ncbi:MAG: polysaccharide deacetylase [Lachnospiraceae bacterium]|nr:polysaccharide deacetylase [Lachnospiraceae bacterium]